MLFVYTHSTPPVHPCRSLQTRQADTLMDKRMVVVIDGWEADSAYPQGHYVRTLGLIGDRDTETVRMCVYGGGQFRVGATSTELVRLRFLWGFYGGLGFCGFPPAHLFGGRG